MRETTTLTIVSILAVGIFSFVPSQVRAQGSSPIWTIGDYWHYEGTTGSMEPMPLIVWLNVTGRASINVGGVTYETYQCSLTDLIRWSPIWGGGNISLYYDLSLRTSDLAMVKEVSGPQTIIYDPPLTNFRFPLSNGQKWTSTTLRTIMMDGGQHGSYTDAETFYHNVSGPLRITVPAGSFDAMVIDTRFGTQEFGRHVYYSDEVGYEVQTTNPSLKLVSFSYEKVNPAHLIIAIVLIIVAVAVVLPIIVLLWIKRPPIEVRPEEKNPLSPPPSS